MMSPRETEEGPRKKGPPRVFRWGAIQGEDAPGLQLPGCSAQARARPLEAAPGGAGRIPGTFRGASVSAGSRGVCGLRRRRGWNEPGG
uniref:Uncharacterized protein n=1 Tax=Mustela putorius furo TaxID=9669 RepID=M3YFT4_MUSPF